MKYIRTKNGNIFEIVDYEQLDENTKKNVRQLRYVGLEDYLNEKIFVKIYKNMPNPISQYQSIKMFDILKQADNIEELCDFKRVEIISDEESIAIRILGMYKELPPNTNIKSGTYGAILTDKGLIYVAKMNEKGELCLI